MGIDVGGAFTISGESPSQSLKIASPTADAITIDEVGRTFYPNQIGFIATLGPPDGGWYAQGTGWLNWNYVDTFQFNRGGGYSGGRFTAPVTGTYLFHWSCYHYKPGVGQGAYIHPQLWVNGGSTLLYPLLAYWTPTGYSFDSEILDLLYLNAGDYVEVFLYHSNAGMSGYLAHTLFSGFLVG